MSSIGGGGVRIVFGFVIRFEAVLSRLNLAFSILSLKFGEGVLLGMFLLHLGYQILEMMVYDSKGKVALLRCLETNVRMSICF